MGASCRSPVVKGKRRCRMHGGAKGSGAPKNNRNAYKHGVYSKEAFQQRAELRAQISLAKKLIKEFG
jgi:hypothetical protein